MNPSSTRVSTMKLRFNFFLLIIGVVAATWGLARSTMVSRNESIVSKFSMAAVPHPNLDRLNESSQVQIKEARARCEFLLSSPKNTDPLLRARAIAELGKHYHAYDLLDAATTCYEFAQQWQPSEFAWSYLLGEVYRHNGQMERAAKSLERALAIAPLDMSVSKDQGIATLTTLGEIYLGASEFDRADNCFRQALEEDSESAIALMKLGQIASLQGDRQQAVDFFEHVLRTTPNAREVLLLLAAEYRKDGETAKAEQTLKQAESLPDVPTIHRNDPLMAGVRELDRSPLKFNRSGRQAMTAGHIGQALQLFQRGLEIEPENLPLLANFGLAWEQLGNHQRAREFWHRGLKVSPHENLYFYLARSHFRAGDYAQALSYIQQALDLKPNDAGYRFLAASVRSHSGSPDEALSAFGDVLAADPAHTGAALGEIRMLAKLGRYSDALQRAERCRQELPDFAGATMAMARILAACPSDDIRDGARAVELARSVYDKQKTVASAETLAMAYAETGAFQLAVETQSWAVQQLVPTGLKDAAARAQRQLSAYENKQVCRQPWADDDPYPAIARPVTISDADED